MPLLARRMGASAVATSLIMTLNIAANTAANLFATLVAHRGGRRLLLYGSFAVFAGGALLAALGRSVPVLFVSTVVMGLANGLFFPILLGLSIQRVDAAHRSTAMGIVIPEKRCMEHVAGTGSRSGFSLTVKGVQDHE